MKCATFLMVKYVGTYELNRYGIIPIRLTAEDVFPEDRNG